MITLCICIRDKVISSVDIVIVVIVIHKLRQISRSGHLSDWMLTKLIIVILPCFEYLSRLENCLLANSKLEFCMSSITYYVSRMWFHCRGQMILQKLIVPLCWPPL